LPPGIATTWIFFFRAYLAGYKLAVCNDLLPIHASHGDYGKRWQAAARKFAEKFRGQLATAPGRSYQLTSMEVPAKRDIVEVMTPTIPGFFPAMTPSKV
jgi:hypothetical protein